MTRRPRGRTFGRICIHSFTSPGPVITGCGMWRAVRIVRWSEEVHSRAGTTLPSGEWQMCSSAYLPSWIAYSSPCGVSCESPPILPWAIREAVRDVSARHSCQLTVQPVRKGSSQRGERASGLSGARVRWEYQQLQRAWPLYTDWPCRER